MQLDRIRRHPFLSFLIIKEPNTGYLHRDIHRLKFIRRRELGFELSARMGDAGSKRTARPNTIRIRNLGNHGTARAVLEDHVVIGIVRADKLHQRRADHPHRGLCRPNSIVFRYRARRRQRRQVLNGRGRLRIEVNQRRVRVSPRLNGPALRIALRRDVRRAQQQEHGTDSKCD